MSALLTPPVLPPSRADTWPRPVPELAGRTYTFDELCELDHPARFGGRRLFLLHGEIWEQGMSNPPHEDCLEIADAAVRQLFPTGFRFRVQLTLELADGTFVEPDILVVRGPRPQGQTHPTTADLIVEVSDTTLAFDTTTKAELYATAGVPEYWVIDVENRRLRVFRDPVPLPGGLGATAYRTDRTFGPDDTVTPLAAPSSPIRVADLLP